MPTHVPSQTAEPAARDEARETLPVANPKRIRLSERHPERSG